MTQTTNRLPRVRNINEYCWTSEISVVKPSYRPAEIADYAQWLGLDLETEQELVWICRDGLKAKLPSDWKALYVYTGLLHNKNLTCCLFEASCRDLFCLLQSNSR